MTALVALVLATLAPPRIEWRRMQRVTTDNVFVVYYVPIEVGPPPRETPLDVLRSKAR